MKEFEYLHYAETDQMVPKLIHDFAQKISQAVQPCEDKEKGMAFLRRAALYFKDAELKNPNVNRQKSPNP